MRCEAGKAGSIREALMRKIAREMLKHTDDTIKEIVGKEEDFEPWARKIMGALLKHGDRVIPESGVSILDTELKRLKNESVDLFHRGVATK